MGTTGWPSGTVAFLFTDIEGSTRLWQEHPATMPAAYARHDAILRASIAAHGGVVYKTVGDAFQAAFAAAPAAAAAALAAQLALVSEPWDAAGLPEPLRVRMALHAGAADPTADGDYRSPVLNRLGRLLGAGHGGQILLSAAMAELVRGTMPPGADTLDLGEQRLRDLLPERVFQLAGVGLPQAFPPLATLDARPNNLPAHLTRFIGRERELAAVSGLLARPEVRLLTLTGPGGTGKTRLGLQVAAEVSARYADGVFFVPLAPIVNPALVPAAIAAVLHLPEVGDRPLLDSLQTGLSDKTLLLVLDNFEQVSAAGPVVAALLKDCPRLTVLVTSRGRIGVYGEHEYPVPPLGLPDLERPVGAATLSQYEAVRLFIARAQAVRPDFAVTNENAPAVAEICVRLDGLPLAIELAAARVRMLPPAAMLARLQSRLPLLTGGGHDLPARQQTLRGAIAWSYELLTPGEQALFRRMSVFAGGCTLQAIGVAAEGDEPGLDVFAGVERLGDLGLLRQAEMPGGEPRFFMLETIREYGFEQLAERGAADEAQRRHAAFYSELAQELTVELSGPEFDLWLDRMQREHDNVRAACEWSVEHDIATAIRLTLPVREFSIRRGFIREARGWTERVLAACGPDVAVGDRAKVLGSACIIGLALGDFENARERGEAALTLARPLGDWRVVATLLGALASVTTYQGDRQRSQELWTELADLARDQDDNALRADVLSGRGFALFVQGDLVLARSLLDEAVALGLEIGDDGALAAVLHQHAVVCRAGGDDAGALSSFREGLKRAWAVKHTAIAADCFQGLGAMAAAAHQPARAARLFGAEAAIRDALGYPHDPLLKDHHRLHVALARAALGEEAYTAAAAAGAALTLEDAVAEALAATDG